MDGAKVKLESRIAAILVGVSVGLLVERYMERKGGIANTLKAVRVNLEEWDKGLRWALENQRNDEPDNELDESAEEHVPEGWGIYDGALTAEMREARKRALHGMRHGTRKPGDLVDCGEILGDEPGVILLWRAICSGDPGDDGALVIFNRRKVDA